VEEEVAEELHEPEPREADDTDLMEAVLQFVHGEQVEERGETP
jgi:hypothetical protein